MRLVKFVILFGAAVAIGCGGSASSKQTTPSGNNSVPSTKPADDQPRPSADQRLVMLFEQLATEVATAGADCGKYAQSVQTWTKANNARYLQLSARVQNMTLRPEQVRANNARLEASLSKVVSGYKRCQTNAQAKAAFKAFDSLIDG